MAARHPGQHRTRKRGFAANRLTGGYRRQRPGGRDVEAVHRLADDVFAQHRAERGTAVAAARERGAAGALELDVPPDAVTPDHFAQQDRPAVAALRHPAAELETGRASWREKVWQYV